MHPSAKTSIIVDRNSSLRRRKLAERGNRTMTMIPIIKVCPLCGRKYSFNPDVGKLFCPYCGHRCGAPVDPAEKKKGWFSWKRPLLRNVKKGPRWRRTDPGRRKNSD